MPARSHQRPGTLVKLQQKHPQWLQYVSLPTHQFGTSAPALRQLSPDWQPKPKIVVVFLQNAKKPFNYHIKL
jgi:hypothetical protein